MQWIVRKWLRGPRTCSDATQAGIHGPSDKDPAKVSPFGETAKPVFARLKSMNPYRVVDPTDVLWKRCGAWAVDATLALVIACFTFLLVRALGGTATATVVTALVSAGYWFFANVVLQGTRGYTPGKQLCGLRVVDADGRPCGPQRALRRSLYWAVDGFPYVLPLTAYAAASGSRQAQRVGDRMAGTYVIDEEFLGSPPVAIALPTDPSSGLLPYRLETAAAYLPPDMDILTMKRLRDARPTSPRPQLARGVDTHWEPRWDHERGAYVRWNAVTAEWVVFDEDQRQWVQVPPANATMATTEGVTDPLVTDPLLTDPLLTGV